MLNQDAPVAGAASSTVSPPAMPIRLVDLLRAVDTARGRTARLAALIPESALDWAPGARARYTLRRHRPAPRRDRAVHVRGDRRSGRSSRYPGHDRRLAYGKEGVLAYLDTMHEQSMALLQTLDDDGARTPHHHARPARRFPTWRWLQLMTEHEAHHRGQLYLMLRLLGVETPSLFGLTEEQLLREEPREAAAALRRRTSRQRLELAPCVSGASCCEPMNSTAQ